MLVALFSASTALSTGYGLSPGSCILPHIGGGGPEIFETDLLLGSRCAVIQAPVLKASRRHTSPVLEVGAIHPAVAGWPDKYSGTASATTGPRVLSTTFAVQSADYQLLQELDVPNWPTWTTKGNDRWLPHVTRKDKEMPYGELSYLISGKLEIIPQETGVPVIVNPGDFVTFPEGFVSDWTVLEELTWHYYLY